jgi:LytS/YehU family sensor histidine kinase
MRLQEVFTKAQLKMLHSQVNPHFMFNILNHVYILMRRDIDLASSLLLKFSEMLRYQFYEGEKDGVPLSLEIKFLQDMVEVEKMRRGSELDVVSVWDTEDGNICIPPLLLVTFVENAFKHVSCSISEKGSVKIELRQRGNTIYMKVENSKSRLGIQKSNEGNSKQEMRNIKENLDVLYPDSYSLAIEDTEAMHIVRLAIEIA